MKNEILLVHSTRQLSAITFKSKIGVKMNNCIWNRFSHHMAAQQDLLSNCRWMQ